jgi:ABC-type branched-subunit amino acid transport system substrate-binding protein
LALVGVVVVVGVVLAACGSSGKTASPPTTTSGATSSPATSSSAAHYKIGAIVDLSNTNGAFTQYLDSFKAEVDATNARGGINGHQVDLVTCDSQGNPNATAQCGRTIASDGVFMVVGVTFSGAYGPYLKAAGIPFSTGINDPTLLNNPYEFTLIGGGLTGIPGLAGAAAGSCKDTVLIDATEVTPAQAASETQNFAAVGSKSGMKTSTEYPGDQPDYAPSIVSAVDHGADCIALNALGAPTLGLVKAAVASPKPVQIYINDYTLDDKTIASLGPAIVSQLHVIGIARPPTSTVPAVVTLTQDLAKYAPGVSGYNIVEEAFVQLAVYAAQHAATVTPAGVYAYLSHLTSYVSGIEPPINFVSGPANPLGPRVVAPFGIRYAYQNGNVYSTGSFYNVFTGATVAG